METETKQDASATPVHSFAPLTEEAIVFAAAPRVDPGLVREVADEIDNNVTTGRMRLRWFSHHMILFAVGIVIAIPLQSFVLIDIEQEFFQLSLAAWVGFLVIHAHYAMDPILRRSSKVGQLEAMVLTSPEPGPIERAGEDLK